MLLNCFCVDNTTNLEDVFVEINKAVLINVFYFSRLQFNQFTLLLRYIVQMFTSNRILEK